MHLTNVNMESYRKGLTILSELLTFISTVTTPLCSKQTALCVESEF